MSIKEWRLLFHYPLPLAVVGLVSIGAALSPTIHLDRLLITYLLLFFGLVMAAYAFDAMYADWRPMIKNIQQWKLWTIALIGMSSFIGISIYAIITTSITGIVVALILITSVVCYNLEHPKWFHNKWGFGLSWGAASIVASFYYQSLQVSWLMMPLAITGFILAIQEWYTTNTKSPIQHYINVLGVKESRRHVRKETFRITSIYCYSILMIGITLLMWRFTW